MSKCDTTYFQNNLLIVTTKNNILGFSQCCNNEVNPVAILRSEKNKSKNLKQDCKNTGYIKGYDRTEYYKPPINKTPL